MNASFSSCQRLLWRGYRLNGISLSPLTITPTQHHAIHTNYGSSITTKLAIATNITQRRIQTTTRPSFFLFTKLQSRSQSHQLIRPFSTAFATSPLYQNPKPISDDKQDPSIPPPPLVKVAIMGPPNAGKSTLYNRLLDKELNRAFRLKSERHRKTKQFKRDKGRFSTQWLARKQHQAGKAIVSDIPGTTRDRRQGWGRIAETYFTLMDTAGIDGERLDHFGDAVHPEWTSSQHHEYRTARTVEQKKQKRHQIETKRRRRPPTSRQKIMEELAEQRAKDVVAQTPQEILKPMMHRALEAAQQADLILFLFDARVGVTGDFEQTCRWLRQHALSPKKTRKQRIMVLANKLEGDSWDHYGSNVHMNMDEATRAGLGPPIPISALQGDGLTDVLLEIEDLQKVINKEWQEQYYSNLPEDEKKKDEKEEDEYQEDEYQEGEYEEDEYEDMEDNSDIESDSDSDSDQDSDSDEEEDYDVKEIEDYLEKKTYEKEEEEDDIKSIGKSVTRNPTIEMEKKEKPLQLAILGRVNVGKSTLVNALLNEERVITGATPGLTRDAIAISWEWKGRPLQLVDTAGLRKPSQRTDNDIEEMAVLDAMRAMKIADVAVLVLDAEARMLQRHELAIAQTVLKEGRALVVVANKMDLIIRKEYTPQDFEKGVRAQLEERFPMLRMTPIVAVSSLTGQAVPKLMPVVFEARDRWAAQISTGKLNNWLQEVLEEHAPPLYKGRPTRIKYIIQTKGRPPTFLLFCNHVEIPESYLRYITRHLQESFGMFGMEVRLVLKMSAKENPYAPKHRVGTGVGGIENKRKRMFDRINKTGTPKKQRKRKMKHKAKQRGRY